MLKFLSYVEFHFPKKRRSQLDIEVSLYAFFVMSSSVEKDKRVHHHFDSLFNVCSFFES